MKCHEEKETASRYLSDLLSAEERAGYERHLGECGECAREVERYRRMISLLQGLPRTAAPANFHEAVMSKISPGEKPAGVRRLSIFRSPVFGAAAAVLALAAGAAIAFKIYDTSFHRGPTPPQLPSRDVAGSGDQDAKGKLADGFYLVNEDKSPGGYDVAAVTGALNRIDGALSKLDMHGLQSLATGDQSAFATFTLKNGAPDVARAQLATPADNEVFLQMAQKRLIAKALTKAGKLDEVTLVIKNCNSYNQAASERQNEQFALDSAGADDAREGKKTPDKASPARPSSEPPAPGAALKGTAEAAKPQDKDLGHAEKSTAPADGKEAPKEAVTPETKPETASQAEIEQKAKALSDAKDALAKAQKARADAEDAVAKARKANDAEKEAAKAEDALKKAKEAEADAMKKVELMQAEAASLTRTKLEDDAIQLQKKGELGGIAGESQMKGNSGQGQQTNFLKQARYARQLGGQKELALVFTQVIKLSSAKPGGGQRALDVATRHDLELVFNSLPTLENYTIDQFTTGGISVTLSEGEYLRMLKYLKDMGNISASIGPLQIELLPIDAAESTNKTSDEAAAKDPYAVNVQIVFE
jgi:hypothetical protein